jgi:hypothetical protein
MSALRANEIWIVGFNGAPLVKCGRALPIAQRISDSNLCVLDLRRGADGLVWNSKEEAAALAADGQWTELEKAVSVPIACVETSTGHVISQPMVVFENEILLDVADRVPRPDHHNGQYLMWQALKGEYTNFFAACASSPAVEAILNDWAEGLLTRFDAMFGMNPDRSNLKRVADFALCAACSRQIRWRAYLRYTATQEPEKVKRTFDRFIHAEFPNVSWFAFVDQMKALKEVWESQPVFTTANNESSHGDSIAPKLHDIANEKPLVLVKK